MSDPVTELVKAHLRRLRLPAMAQELETLSRAAAAANQNYEQFLLRLTEAELTKRGVVFNHHAVESGATNLRTFAIRDPEGNTIQFFGQ